MGYLSTAKLQNNIAFTKFLERFYFRDTTCNALIFCALQTVILSFFQLADFQVFTSLSNIVI